MRRLGIVAAVLAVMVMLTSCGDGKSESDQEAIDEVIAALDARLRDGGLEPAADQDDEEDDGGLEFESEECQDLDRLFGDDEELPGETASAETEMEMEAEDGSVTVTGMLGLTDDAEELDEYFGLLADARVPGCLQEALEAELSTAAAGSGFELTPFTVEALQSGVGEDSVGFRFSGGFTVQGTAIPMTMEMEFARLGRAGAGALVFTSGAAQSPMSRVEVLELLVGGIQDTATS